MEVQWQDYAEVAIILWTILQQQKIYFFLDVEQVTLKEVGEYASNRI
jgi:hypothetical protein